MIMTPHLSPDVQQAVKQNHGYTEADGDGSKFIVMTMEFYRVMLGIGDAELSQSLQAIAESRKDIEAGRVRPFRDVMNELGT